MREEGLLKKLVAAHGVSGFEKNVRKIIEEEAAPYADEMTVDAIGNLIVLKKGTDGENKKKLMFAAHMDEIGFMVKKIEADGRLKVCNMGWNWAGSAYNERVEFQNGVNGVVGCEGWIEDAKNDVGKLFIDIGATSAEDANSKARKPITNITASKRKKDRWRRSRRSIMICAPFHFLQQTRCLMGNIRKLACSQHFAQRYRLVLFFLLHGADADEQRIHAQIWLTQLFRAGLHLPQRPFIVPILPAHLPVLHVIQCFAVSIFQGQLIKEGLSSYHLTQPQVTADARLDPLPVLPVFILYLRPSFLKRMPSSCSPCAKAWMPLSSRSREAVLAFFCTSASSCVLESTCPPRTCVESSPNILASWIRINTMRKSKTMLPNSGYSDCSRSPD